MSRKSLLLASAAAALLVSAPAYAGPKVFSPGNTVTSLSGSVETNVNQNRDPFLLQVFTTGNECLRVAVTSQGADLEATLVSPSGNVWQDDDGNGSLRPLVKAVTDVRGWYPLMLSHFSGAPVNADFTATVQRLPTASPLCASPTTPRSLNAATLRAAKPTAPTRNAPGGAN